jgi:hypothetical protein
MRQSLSLVVGNVIKSLFNLMFRNFKQVNFYEVIGDNEGEIFQELEIGNMKNSRLLQGEKDKKFID